MSMSKQLLLMMKKVDEATTRLDSITHLLESFLVPKPTDLAAASAETQSVMPILVLRR